MTGLTFLKSASELTRHAVVTERWGMSSASLVRAFAENQLFLSVQLCPAFDYYDQAV